MYKGPAGLSQRAWGETRLVAVAVAVADVVLVIVAVIAARAERGGGGTDCEEQREGDENGSKVAHQLGLPW